MILAGVMHAKAYLHSETSTAGRPGALGGCISEGETEVPMRFVIQAVYLAMCVAAGQLADIRRHSSVN
jgi:hypothetical protein